MKYKKGDFIYIKSDTWLNYIKSDTIYKEDIIDLPGVDIYDKAIGHVFEIKRISSGRAMGFGKDDLIGILFGTRDFLHVKDSANLTYWRESDIRLATKEEIEEEKVFIFVERL